MFCDEARFESVVGTERFNYDVGVVEYAEDFTPLKLTPQPRDATAYGPEGPRGISNTFSLTEESILISLNLRTTVS